MKLNVRGQLLYLNRDLIATLNNIAKETVTKQKFRLFLVQDTSFEGG
jgi:hypothetical protein